MPTTKEMLNELNDVRRINDKPPLKSWKESRQKLSERIAAEYVAAGEGNKQEPGVAKGAYKDNRTAEQKTGKRIVKDRVKGDLVNKVEEALSTPQPPKPKKGERGSANKIWKPTKPVGKAAKNKKSPYKNPRTASVDGTGIRVADIAREIGMDPKQARAKLRRNPLPLTWQIKKHLFIDRYKNDVKKHLQEHKSFKENR